MIKQMHVVALLLLRGDPAIVRACLGDVLAGLAAQRRRPDEVHAVLLDERLDPRLDDDLRHLLTAHGVTIHRRGDRVGIGSALDAAVAPLQDAGVARRSWLWLLRPDSVPDPDALAELLAAAERAPSVAVAGCKQVEWDDDQRLRDVGLHISRLGSVVTGLDRGELDQGQHDARADVLAVRLAGMLVRRDVWQALGGPDPALSARADVELCRRVHLAGHRVVVVPEARMATAAEPGYREERRDALALRLAWVPWWLVPFALVWSVVAGLVRAAARLVGKQPRRSIVELVVTAEVLVRPWRWIGVRRRQRRGRAVPVSALRPLRAASRALIRQRRDELAGWIRPGRRGLRRARRPAWWRTHLPGLAVIAAVTAAGVVPSRHLLGPGSVVSESTLPLPADAGALWRAAVGSWRPDGLGSAGVGDPLAALLAALSWLTWPWDADPRRLVALLLLLAPGLAALVGYLVAAAVTPSRAVRCGAALVWAAAPPLLAAGLTGTPGPVLAHLALPPLALALQRAFGPRGSVTAGAGASLLLTAAIAAVPSLAALLAAALVVAAVAGVAARRTGRAAPLLAAPVVAAVPAVLLAPWWAAVARHPQLLAADPAGATDLSELRRVAEQAMTRLADLIAPGPIAGAPPATLLLVALALATGPLLVGGVLGLWRRHGWWWAALAGALVAVGALGALLTVPRLAVGEGRPGLGAAASVLLAGVGVAALAAVPALTRRLRRMRPWRRRVLTVAVCLLGGVGPALLLGAYAAAPVLPGRSGSLPLPAVAAAEQAGPLAARTLVLAVDDGSVRWNLMRQNGSRFGSVNRSAPVDDTGVVQPVLATLLSDTGRDARRDLARLAVGTVMLLPPADPEAEQALDAAVGLVRVGSSGRAAMWRVDPPPDDAAGSRPTRVRVVDAAGAARHAVASRDAGLGTSTLRPAGPIVDTDLPDGAPGRRLVLAERADPGWQATLDGVRLGAAPPDGGWAQTFALPQHGGRLVVTHRSDPAWLNGRWFGWLWLATLVLAALTTLPLPDVRTRIGAPPAPRATRPVPREVDLTEPLPVPPPRVFDETHPEHGELPPAGTP